MKATSDLELLVRLDRASPVPLHLQLERQLREAARSGRLRPGTALPATRVLAAELGVARGVVSNAYTQLTAEGYLVSRRGSATRVSERSPADASLPARGAEPARPPRFDLRPGTPDVALFPRAAWARAAAHALRTAPDDRFGYPSPQGTVELRTELAAYLGRARGVVADPGALVITSGVAQGLALITRVLLARGLPGMALEDPGTAPIRAQLEAGGLATVPVAVDEDGIDVAALARSGASSVLVTPAHQFPTGAVLSPARRAALVEWDGLVLEDDYDAEYRYDRAPVGALQGLAPDRVVYLGSVSKTLAPALRTGWLVVPPSLLDEVLLEKEHDDKGTPVLEQLALARLLAQGEIDRHIRRSRLVYRRRRDALLAALARELPEATASGIAAGLHVVLALPDGIDDQAVATAAQARGVAVVPLSRHCTRPRGAALILGYAQLAEAAIPAAASALAAAISSARGTADARGSSRRPS